MSRPTAEMVGKLVILGTASICVAEVDELGEELCPIKIFRSVSPS